MMGEDVYVLCPLYSKRKPLSEIEKADFPEDDDRYFISCEGPVEGTYIHWIFPGKKAAKEQERIFCKKHFKRCEIYRSVMYNRYNEVDENG